MEIANNNNNNNNKVVLRTAILRNSQSKMLEYTLQSKLSPIKKALATVAFEEITQNTFRHVGFIKHQQHKWKMIKKSNSYRLIG